tara:strand:+ start:833 stop:1462 length:630 start_codon:yes stop_codon:yes gene_type:complete
MYSDSPELNEEYRRLCLAVGHLMVGFSRLESVMTTILKLHLALNMGEHKDKRALAISSAIYGSMRYTASRDTMKRLIIPERVAKHKVDFLTKLFAQIGEIQIFRDRIAHQLMTPSTRDLGGFWQINDMVTTRNVAEPKIWVFDTEVVMKVANDIVKISNRIGSVDVTATLFSGDMDLSPISWQYKPSMLKLIPHDKLKIPPEQQPQPES